jgi:hypothetical protein
MHQDPDGLAALRALDYDRFVHVLSEDYQSAEEIESQISLGDSTP